MKKITKIVAFICFFAMLLSACALSFTGCIGRNDVSDTSESGDTSAVIVDGKTDYTVSIKSIGGLSIPQITIFIYADEALEDLVGYGITDENGIAVINLPVANGYRIVLSDPPEGYIAEASYGFTGTSAAIVLNTQIIDDPDLSGVTYGLGSVMHDFTVTDSEGNSYTLSEILKEKDMVMLNFWYTTCSYCVAEFP
ncbi:MAG: redoxin domain-containing protein, partial [Clostridia bacterium]|nr:redoxin domain-containing protein [Clostridia bacterium]